MNRDYLIVLLTGIFLSAGTFTHALDSFNDPGMAPGQSQLLVASAVKLVTDPMATRACPNAVACVSLSHFDAVVTDLRISGTSNERIVTIAIRFTNTSSKRMILGYVANSGLVVDDQGNRYVQLSVRGIGQINGNNVDANFSLQPGESSDARFEFHWFPGNTIYGTSFDAELAVREIVPVVGNQLRIGKEHVLAFRRMGEKSARTRSPAVSAAPTAESMDSSVPSAPYTDPCDGKTGCYSSGPFVANVVRVTTSRQDNPNATGPSSISQRVEVRFRNASNRPIILAHTLGTSSLVDSNGNRYHHSYGNPRKDVTGIGLVAVGTIDPGFTLRPGESRNATFEHFMEYYSSNTTLGMAYTIDLQIAEVESTPSRQLRIVREYAVSFRDITAGGYGGPRTPGAGGTGDMNQSLEKTRKAFDNLKNIFK